MRILYFSPRDCWPTNTGARLRDYHLAHQLARNATVDYVGLRAPADAPAATLPESAGFRQIILEREPGYTPAKLVGGLLGPLPVTLRNFWSPQVAAQIRQMLGEQFYDVVQIEGVHLAPYVEVIRQASPRTRINADWHNIESELMWRYAEGATGARNWPKRLYAQRTASLIERCENTLLERCDLHTVVSAREKEKLLQRRPGARVEVVPNGVDVTNFSAVDRRRAQARNLIFVGSMDYHANIDAVCWFVSEVWPAIRARGEGWKLQIVGRNPTPAVSALAASDVIVTGTVADVRDYYAEATALVVPLRVGGGTRLKILEAMAAGVPVISTALGAEGIDCENGIHIRIENFSAGFCESIAEISVRPELYQRLAEQAKVLVNERYDWTGCGRSLFTHLQSITNNLQK